MKIPSPEHVFNSKQTTLFADRALKEIAEKLNSNFYVTNNHLGTPNNPYFKITVPGLASYGDIYTITSTLLLMGWGNVIVNNSGDLVEIEIYRNKQPKPIEVDGVPLVTNLDM